MVDESDQVITVEAEKEKAKDGSNFDDDQAITPDFERQVREYYGLESLEGAEDRGAYGAYYSDEEPELDAEERVGPDMRKGDVEDGEFREDADQPEGVAEPGSDLEDKDELRVQRSEEELEVGLREREAGSVNVRKSVSTEREEVRVPKRREEVEVERVPATGEAREVTEADIGEDEEFVVRVYEEEVVVSKRVVLKEEIRLRKKVVEEEEVVEVDLRKEEVEIDDQTNHGPGNRAGQ